MNRDEQINTTVEIIIGGSEKGNQLLFSDEDYSADSFFEVLIFNGINILNKLKSKIPNDFSSVKEKFFQDLFFVALTEGYSPFLPCIPGDLISFIDFISQREKQYSAILNTKQDFTNMLACLTYNLYEKPLQIGTNKSNDLALMTELSIKMEHIIDFQNECVSVIIENCKFN